jgi:hypothetical protein
MKYSFLGGHFLLDFPFPYIMYLTSEGTYAIKTIYNFP